MRIRRTDLFGQRPAASSPATPKIHKLSQRVGICSWTKHDTAVTDAVAAVLLERRDLAGARLFAAAITDADDKHLDHLYNALTWVHINDHGAEFIALARNLTEDAHEDVRTSGEALLR